MVPEWWDDGRSKKKSSRRIARAGFITVALLRIGREYCRGQASTTGEMRGVRDGDQSPYDHFLPHHHVFLCGWRPSYVARLLPNMRGCCTVLV